MQSAYIRRKKGRWLVVTQLTVRDVPVEDVELLKREAAARHVSLNAVLRDGIAAQAEQIRRRARMKETIRGMDELRTRIAEEAGGYLTDSTQLIREDRDNR
jgi:hypothetical protein